MNRLDIGDQATAKNQVAPKIAQLSEELGKRREVWDRLTPLQRLKWLTLAEKKDPVLWLAYQTWRDLDEWFGDLEGLGSPAEPKGAR